MNVVITNGFGEYVGPGGNNEPAHLATVFETEDASGINVPPGYRITTTRPQARPLVYVAGPITAGDLAHNVNQGTLATMHLTAAGYAPLCPMWSVFSSFPALPHSAGCIALGQASGNVPYEDVLDVDLNLIRQCAYLVRLPGDSPGADREVDFARKHGVPVYYGVEELIGPPRWTQEFTVQGDTTGHVARAYRKIDLVHAVRHAVAALGHQAPASVEEPRCLV